MKATRTSCADPPQCCFGCGLEEDHRLRCSKPAAYRSRPPSALYWCTEHAAHLGPSTLIKLDTPELRPQPQTT